MSEHCGYGACGMGTGRWRARRVGSSLPTLAALAFLMLLGALRSPQLAACPPASSQPGSEISPAAAQSLASKIAVLSNAKTSASDNTGPVQITDMEANSYLRFRGHEFLPPAVQNPEVHITPDRISGAADVDFDQLEEVGAQTDDWGVRILAMVFKGKQRVLAAAKLETSDGKGKLTIENLTVGTTSIPAGFVNFLVQSYLQRKHGIDLSKPFNLPRQVSYIEMGSGHAVFHRAVARKTKTPAGQ